jgi:hypothetical protein
MSARAGVEVAFDRVGADAVIAVDDEGILRVRGRQRSTKETGQSKGGSRATSHSDMSDDAHPAAIWLWRWGESMTGLD